MPKIDDFKILVTKDMEEEYLASNIPDALHKVLQSLKMEVRYYDKAKCPFGAYKNYPGVHFVAPSYDRPVHHQIWIDRNNSHWEDTLIHEVGHAVVSEFSLPRFGWQHSPNSQINERNELIVSDLCDMLEDIWVERYLEQMDISREYHKKAVARTLLEDACITAGTEGSHSTTDIVRLCKSYTNARIQLGGTRFCITSIGLMYPIAENRFVGKHLSHVLGELVTFEQQLHQPSNLSKLLIMDACWEALTFIHQHDTIDKAFGLHVGPEIRTTALRAFQCVMNEFKYDTLTYAKVVPKIATLLSVRDIIEGETLSF